MKGTSSCFSPSSSSRKRRRQWSLESLHVKDNDAKKSERELTLHRSRFSFVAVTWTLLVLLSISFLISNGDGLHNPMQSHYTAALAPLGYLVRPFQAFTAILEAYREISPGSLDPWRRLASLSAVGAATMANSNTPDTIIHTITVFAAASQSQIDSPHVKHQLNQLQQRYTPDSSWSLSNATQLKFRLIGLVDVESQEAFLRENCRAEALERYQAFLVAQQAELALEIVKYCALATEISPINDSGDDVLFVDLSSPLLVDLLDLVTVHDPKSIVDDSEINEKRELMKSSIAILGADKYFSRTISGSMMRLHSDHHQRKIAAPMLDLLTTTPLSALYASPLLIPRKLFILVLKDVEEQRASAKTTIVDKNNQISMEIQVVEEPLYTNDNFFDDSEETPLKPGLTSQVDYPWILLKQDCQMNPLQRTHSSAKTSHGRDPSVVSGEEQLFACPDHRPLCCSVVDSSHQQMIQLNPSPMIPNARLNLSELENHRPLNAVHGFFDSDELPFVSTIRSKSFERPQTFGSTENLYDILKRQNRLPKADCNTCLHKRGCSHDEIEQRCRDYFETVCDVPWEKKFLAKEFTVIPPLYRRDPSRLIPRIVHQTWYEPLTKRKYPNMSRLAESFRQSGWEYKFYLDADAEAFLATHFPPEVLEAYRALIPGAFKADLFRYCALLIHGGVYADVDILLEASLDQAIEPDIGFMVPMDEPDGCLWQGFIAAAPGHPYLAQAIETVVNQVRNRFTSVDTDAMFCPNPNFSVLHRFDVLFTAGPGLLGASINHVLGRNGQAKYEPGEPEIDGPTDGADDQHGGNASTNVLSPNFAVSNFIPGRTIILRQDKMDLGSHRFTFLEKNVVIASTDLDNSDDRLNAKTKASSEEQKKTKQKHYSKAHAKSNIYGVEGLYDPEAGPSADEDVRIKVDTSREREVMTSILRPEI